MAEPEAAGPAQMAVATGYWTGYCSGCAVNCLAMAAQDAAKKLAWREPKAGNVLVGMSALTSHGCLPNALGVVPRYWPR